VKDKGVEMSRCVKLKSWK